MKHALVLSLLALVGLTPAVAQTITIYPGGSTIPKGTSRQMSAYVPLSPDTVTWSINGVIGGNPTFGTVSQTGLYAAPADIPAPNLITITVASTAYPAKVTSVPLTITQPVPNVWSTSPKTFAPGAVSFSVNGSDFLPGVVITINNLPLTTTYLSPTGLKVTGNVPASMVGKAAIRAVNPAPGSTTSSPVNVTIANSAVSLNVTPGTATLQLNATQPFSATVSGTMNTAVTWTASVGSISAVGVYTAPAALPSPPTALIRATSAADPLVSATATVTLTQPAVQVSVTPITTQLQLGATQQFSATVTGNANTAVTWTASPGTISSTGLYTPPASLPSPASATVRATSVALPTSYAQATITLTQPAVKVTVTPATSQLQPGTTQQFSATVTGDTNTAVTWTASPGTISATGLYTAPASLPNPASATVRATSVALPASYAQATITLRPPPAAMPILSHARLLDQAGFGPTQQELQNVAQLGIDGWINQQFNTPETLIPIPPSNSDAASQYTSRLVHAPDQLRQRVANALGKIIIVSAAKNPYTNELVPYLQILSKQAFGNYRQLLWDITVSPQMGKYLDLANSKISSPGSMPNENYPRELMQLFSVGLVMLNPDGSPKLDAQGKTIPTYDQNTVAQTARALTGWTYPTPAGGTMGVSNWESFNAPAMEPREQFHDQTAKTLIGGCPIPAGLNVTTETAKTLDCIFNHPNTAPFVVIRLIRDLVTSNPTGPYVERVVNIWNNNGAGVKGDLKAVVNTILTDPEARQDQPLPQQGRLKDSIYHIVSFIRALNGSLTPDNLRSWNFTQMGQQPLAPASVFGHYSLLYRLKGGALAAPEFQIYSSTESMLRGNFFHEIINNPNAGDLKIDLTPFYAVSTDPLALIDLINARLLYGRMPQALKDSLNAAMAAASDNNQRVITALYLTALSGYYTVQY